jgi:hypothetical protein
MFTDEHQLNRVEEMTVIPPTPASLPAEPPAAPMQPVYSYVMSDSESPEPILRVAEENRLQEGTDVDMSSEDGDSVVPVVSVTEEDISMEGKC